MRQKTGPPGRWDWKGNQEGRSRPGRGDPEVENLPEPRGAAAGCGFRGPRPQAPLPGGGGTMRGEDPARAGHGSWGRQASTLPAAELSRGSRGQGTQDRPGRMGAARGGSGCFRRGVSAAPGNSRVSCQSPWEDGSLGSLAVIQPPATPWATCANTPGAGRPLPCWAGGLDQVRGLCWAPDTQAAIGPSDLCVLGTS